MKRKATTILAVVITASASIACGGAAETNEPPNDQSGQQPFSGDGTKTDPTPPPAPTGGGTAPTAPGTSPPATPPAACNKDALNSELAGTILETAVKEHAHFRCLCDDKGYPLVGNINAKGATASQFCSAIKEKGLL